MEKLATIKEISEGHAFDLRFEKTNVFKGYEGINNKDLIFSYSWEKDKHLSIIMNEFYSFGLSTCIDLAYSELFIKNNIFHKNFINNPEMILSDGRFRLFLLPHFIYKFDKEKDVEAASSSLPDGLKYYMCNKGALTMELHIVRKSKDISAKIIVVYDDNYYFIEMTNHFQNE